MAHQMDYIDYLANEIGPRSAGTEEEQQAALFIADTFQTETGFPTEIEDVVSSSNAESPKPICALVTVVVALIAMIFPQFMLPAAIIAIISAVIYVLESTGRQVLTKALSKGASQNVVAKYVPSSSDALHKRKIILVAHYDTGKVTPPLVAKFESMGIPWSLVCTAAMVFVPVFLLLRALLFGAAEGAAAIVLNVITLVGVVLAVLPVVRAVMLRVASLSDGANDNASGVSALMEVAKNISKGLMNEDQIEDDTARARIHGERAAVDAGLVPDGVEIQYHVPENEEIADENRSPEERLSAAKAAIAALTGEAVSTTTYVKPASEAAVNADNGEIRITEIPNADSDSDSVQETFVSVENGAAETTDAAPQSKGESDFNEQTDENVPDWFAAAQRKAKRSPQRPKPAQRSRYADALDAALSESAAIFDEANKLVFDESEDRMRARSADIVEVAPPSPADRDAIAAAGGAMSPITATISAIPEGAAAEYKPADEPVPQVEESASVASVAPAAPVTEAAADKAEIVAAEPIGETSAFAPIVMTPEELAALGANNEAVSSAQAASEPDAGNHDLNLPDFSDFEVPSVAEPSVPDFLVQGQRAPLAEPSSNASARALASTIPAVVGPGMAVPEQTSPSKSGAMRALRTKLPSLSGSIERIGDQEITVSNVSSVGSFVAAGSTGSIEPVGDELLQDLDSEDAYIEDADDSDIEDNYTETGAFAGPDYVEMPKSRIRGFFDKFRFGSKKSKREEETPQEWLDVEDDFDPRAVGKERGGWDSFRDENIESRRNRDNAPEFVGEDDYSAEYDDYAEDSYDDYSDPYADPYGDDGWDGNRKWQGGSMSRVRLGRVDMRSSSEGDSQDAAAALDEDIETPAEVNAVYQFRNPNFETEVWFVALGSEVDRHDGIRAFIDAHHNELHGAVIVDIEAIGAGTLSYARKEGALAGAETTSRMKRYVQKASRESGIPCEPVLMLGIETSASVAAAAGVQSLHILGTDGGVKALTSQGEDVFAHIDPQCLEENTYFVEELVKSI